jgi:hypothetical protein
LGYDARQFWDNNNMGLVPATSLPFNYIVFSLQQWAGDDAEKILFLYILLLVKTPKRELLKIICRLKTLFGDNTNKGGGQKPPDDFCSFAEGLPCLEGLVRSEAEHGSAADPGRDGKWLMPKRERMRKRRRLIDDSP